MKTKCKRLIGLVLILMIFSDTTPLWADDDTTGYVTISGVVRDKQNKKKLENVNISSQGSNVGTVTNADGEFSLKIRKSDSPVSLGISHIGYLNNQIPLDEKDHTDLTIWMTPYVNVLNEIVIQARDPLLIVQEAIKKIPANYGNKSNMLTGFYREIAQKKRRYIDISEAVIDIYKTPYREPADHDRVQIFKGRRLLSQKNGDTLAVKLLGGPTMVVYLDMVKNQDFLLDSESLSFYHFRMEESTVIDNRAQFVIGFQPKVTIPYALYHGKLYIDKERLSFTRAEFSLCMDDKEKAIRSILKRKPSGLRFKPLEVSYLIAYKNHNNTTYLNYMSTNLRFKCDWKRKLFSTTYTILSEMVVTDLRENNVTAIPYKESFKLNQIFADKLDDFTNENFWGNYNIIEPTESLENAVSKLRKQQK